MTQPPRMASRASSTIKRFMSFFLYGCCERAKREGCGGYDGQYDQTADGFFVLLLGWFHRIGVYDTKELVVRPLE